MGRPERSRRISKGGIPFFGKSIPRANHLADVAAENPIAHIVTHFSRNVLFELNGEIGNATGRVDGAIGENAIRGASFDATRACTTMICDER